MRKVRQEHQLPITDFDGTWVIKAVSTNCVETLEAVVSGMVSGLRDRLQTCFHSHLLPASVER